MCMAPWPRSAGRARGASLPGSCSGRILGACKSQMVRQANGLSDHRDFNSAPRGEPRHTYQFFWFTTITSEMLAHARCARSMIFSQEINHARTYVHRGYGTPVCGTVQLSNEPTARGSCHTSSFKWTASWCRVWAVPNFFSVHRPSSSTTSIACLYMFFLLLLFGHG
jgi:hypothetical protein